MNLLLEKLQPYPFQKFSRILNEITPNKTLAQIRLSIGEPQHETPDVILKALKSGSSLISKYPTTQGSVELRKAIASWVERRFSAEAVNPDSNILPVNGTREALFALGQVCLSHREGEKFVVMPNPFYQIYEGSALLGGANPAFLNLGMKENGWDLNQLDEKIWSETELLYVCNPGNPTGHVMNLDEWSALFELSDRHQFTIASDECYSEIYFDESNPPLGAISASAALGRNLDRLVLFSSLSKRSNVPGMRSGFVCGDPNIIEKFLLYRTYHGSAMNPAIQQASIAAWNDEDHVVSNRALYKAKFDSFIQILEACCEIEYPSAGFYVWLKTPIDDIEFAKQLYEKQNVVVLPGSLLAREAHGFNPGKNRVRIALVTEKTTCDEAAHRLKEFLTSGFN